MKHVSEEIVVVSLSLVFILISIFPAIYFYIKTPSDSVYTFLHNSVRDYPVYISFIREGTNGNLFTYDQFTSEPQQKGLIHIFYSLLGKIGGFLGLTPILIYFLARILFGAVFSLTAYIFISYFLKNKRKRLLAFFFFLTSVSFPNLIFNKGGIEIRQYLFWWTEMDPLRRMTFLPHFLIGHIGLIMALLLLLKSFSTGKFHYLLIAGIIGLFTGIVYPPSLGMVYYIFGGYFFVSFLLSLRKKLRQENLFHKIINNLWFFLIFFLITIPVTYYIYYTTNNIFPWTLTKGGESLYYYIPLNEYLLSLGPIILLGTLGIIMIGRRIIRSNFDKGDLVLALWVIIDIVMIPFSKYLAFASLPLKIPMIANIRFLSMAIHLPLSILSVYWLFYLKEKFGNKLFNVIIGGYVVLTLVIYPNSVTGQLKDFSLARNFVYPKKSLVEAFLLLDKTAGENEVVLAGKDNSLILPLFAKNKLYYGQAIYTYNYEIKAEEGVRFLSGKMTPEEGNKFVKGNRISYVLTDDNGGKKFLAQYPFLKLIFTKDRVSIYKN